MVLFVFVVMMLNLGKAAADREGRWLKKGSWWGPGILALLLLAELIYALGQGEGGSTAGGAVGPKEVALSLFGPYLIGVELASFLLLAGIVGAFHLGMHARARGGES
jgi:NADH-quinone oxidoreductase subunit J